MASKCKTITLPGDVAAALRAYFEAHRASA
jgi:hypothetical protein